MIHSFFIEHSYLIGLVSFLIGWLGMPIVVRIAKAKGFVVRPNKRMSHTGAVPNIGGLNIYFSVMLSYLLFDYNQIANNQFFLIGVAAIMAIGFISQTAGRNSRRHCADRIRRPADHTSARTSGHQRDKRHSQLPDLALYPHRYHQCHQPH